MVSPQRPGVRCGFHPEGVRMKTVLVASSKGGVGKTTIATHIAAQSAIDGLRTALVDADPQESSTRWAQRRALLDSAVLPLDGTRRKAWRKHLPDDRSEEHTSELQSQSNLVCRLLLEKKKKKNIKTLHKTQT